MGSDNTNLSYLRWIPYDLGSKRFNCVDFQLGVLAKRSVTESNAYPFVNFHGLAIVINFHGLGHLW